MLYVRPPPASPTYTTHNMDRRLSPTHTHTHTPAALSKQGVRDEPKGGGQGSSRDGQHMQCGSRKLGSPRPPSAPGPLSRLLYCTLYPATWLVGEDFCICHAWAPQRPLMLTGGEHTHGGRHAWCVHVSSKGTVLGAVRRWRFQAVWARRGSASESEARREAAAGGQGLSNTATQHEPELSASLDFLASFWPWGRRADTCGVRRSAGEGMWRRRKKWPSPRFVGVGFGQRSRKTAAGAARGGPTSFGRDVVAERGSKSRPRSA